MYVGGGDEWTYIGKTPIDHVRLPLGILRWRFEADHIETSERTFAAVQWDSRFALAERGSVPQGMVGILGGVAFLGFTGFDPDAGVPLQGFSIDKYEVTNAQFKEFVDAGGYERQEYWQHPFVRNGQQLS